MRVIVDIEEALRRQAETLAAERGITLSALAETALRQLLAQPTQPGGRRPGADETWKSNVIDEMEGPIAGA